MNALMIKDPLYWNDQWSAEIGRRLDVRDSSVDLFIFDRQVPRELILEVLHDVPPENYRLFELSEAPADNCDFQGDSGTCYRRLH